jgi:hypothetical protein
MTLPLSAWDYKLSPCANPLCERLTTAFYCCGSCDYAHQHKFEIHSGGPLGHSDGCNKRHADRVRRKARPA